MTHHCNFCDFTTEDRHQIHIHHIKPKELNGTNDKYNLITVCGNCHSKIYIPESKSGIHSIKSKNSIIIKEKLFSTAGMLISYEENNSDKLTIEKK